MSSMEFDVFDSNFVPNTSTFVDPFLFIFDIGGNILMRINFAQTKIKIPPTTSKKSIFIVGMTT